MGLGHGDGDCNGPRVPALYRDNNPMHALSVHAVAKATVEAVVQEAVEALAHAVEDATQWLTGAVRGEVISKAVVDADSPDDDDDKPHDVEDEPEQSSAPESLERDETLQTEVFQSFTRSPSATIHAVAKATVDAVTVKAVKDVAQVVEKANEWISQADDKPIDVVDEQEHPSSTASPERDETLQPEVLQPFTRPLSATIHAVAKATVDAITNEAVKDIAQTVEKAAKWIAQAVVVADSEPIDTEEPEEPSSTESSERHETFLSGVVPPLFIRTPRATIHAVAKATVDAATDEAIKDIVQAVDIATKWISQVVVADDNLCNDDKLIDVEGDPEQPSATKSSERNETLQTNALSRPSSAIIHTVAKATVDTITDEAVNNIVQAVEKATEWISQAVSNEVVSQSMDPNETVAFQNATEWITQAVRSELVAHAVADVIPFTNNFTDSEEQQENAATPENAETHDVPRLLLPVSEASVSDVHELAKEIAETAVNTALQNVTRAIKDASKWLIQAVSGELVAQTVVDASPYDETHVDRADSNSTDSPESEEPQQPSTLTEKADTPVQVPPLHLPNATDSSPEAAARYHDQAVSLINAVFSSALRQPAPVTSPEPQEYQDDGYEDYTPINSPTSEDTSSRSPVQSTRSPEEEVQSVPPAILSGRATPPGTKPTSRRQSPITTKRGLGTPTPRENAPSSAPPAILSPHNAQEAPTNFIEPEPSQQTLPPLVLPAVQVSGRTKHQHKTPRKTPRQPSPASNPSEEIYTMETPPTSSSRLNKHIPRAAISAELELTPKSSARAAAIIYTQPPSSRHHHHRHKSKKLRDSASQTSPPPSPPPTSLPHQPPHDESNSSELPKTLASHSKRDLSSPENASERNSNNSLLAPLSKTSVIPPPSTTKSPTSPSRTHRNHGHGNKGHGGGPSPNKRSGYCPRCVFEGRSCKINDCLKHQVLK